MSLRIRDRLLFFLGNHGLQSERRTIRAVEDYFDYLLAHGWVNGGIIRIEGEPTPEKLLEEVEKEYELRKRVLGLGE